MKLLQYNIGNINMFSDLNNLIEKNKIQTRMEKEYEEYKLLVPELKIGQEVKNSRIIFSENQNKQEEILGQLIYARDSVINGLTDKEKNKEDNSYNRNEVLIYLKHYSAGFAIINGVQYKLHNELWAITKHVSCRIDCYEYGEEDNVIKTQNILKSIEDVKEPEELANTSFSEVFVPEGKLTQLGYEQTSINVFCELFFQEKI